MLAGARASANSGARVTKAPRRSRVPTVAGRVLHLPAQGRLLVCTDLQGNLRDFQQVLRHFAAAGPDAHLVLTGDLVHGPDQATVDAWPEHLGTPYVDESPAVVRAFAEAQGRWPGRVHCLLGNHDHAHVGGPRTSKFHDDEAAVLEARLGPEGTQALQRLVRTFPLAAVAPCGAVLTHAAPATRVDGEADLEAVRLDGWTDMDFTDFARDVPVLGPLLWARGATPEQARGFVRALGGTVSIYGHDVVREGFAADSDEQVCVSTSFGLFDAHKVYVDLDLAKSYGSVRDLRPGHELRRLYASPTPGNA